MENKKSIMTKTNTFFREMFLWTMYLAVAFIVSASAYTGVAEIIRYLEN